MRACRTPVILNAAILRIGLKKIFDAAGGRYDLGDIGAIVAFAVEILLKTPDRITHTANPTLRIAQIAAIRRRTLHLVTQIRLEIVELRRKCANRVTDLPLIPSLGLGNSRRTHQQSHNKRYSRNKPFRIPHICHPEYPESGTLALRAL